jgi:D-alanyl-D-alanine carboxypeptidase
MSTGERRMDTSTMGTTVDGALSVTMSRRRVLRLLGAAGATAVLAGATRATPASAAQQLRTLSSLNLRAKPRADARVLRVMPEGATVTRIPGGSGRYVKVVYDGTRGYAHLDYLDDAADQGGGGETPGGETGEIVGLTSTTTDVNLRSGPSTGSAVIRVLEPGAVVNYTFTIENGFRQVEHQGRWGWAWDAFLDFQAGPERG